MEENTTENTENKPVKEKIPCRNCDKAISINAKFCPQCGQKNNDGKVTMKELFHRFWQNLTHLDSKFVKMCWQLFVPGVVTQEYFKGRHKRYPHPVQFFFIVMFFFLFVFNHTYEGNFADVNLKNSSDENKLDAENIDYNVFFEAMRKYQTQKAFILDFEKLPENYKTKDTKAGLDSILKQQNPMSDLFAQDIKKQDSTTFNIGTTAFRISTTDIINKKIEQIFVDYKVNDWKSKIIIKQGIKTFKDPKSLINAYMGNKLGCYCSYYYHVVLFFVDV
jgi:hypothetical protein